MANKDLTTVRADQPADTPSNSTIIWCEKNGNTRGFTLDEISLLLQGATVQQGLQDAHRGCLLYNGNGAHTAGAIDWDSAIYDTESSWSAVSLTRISPADDATKIRLTACVSGMVLPISGDKIYMTKNGESSPAVGLPIEEVNGRESVSLSSAVITHTPGDYYELIKSKNGVLSVNSWFAHEVIEQVQAP